MNSECIKEIRDNADELMHDGMIRGGHDAREMMYATRQDDQNLCETEAFSTLINSQEQLCAEHLIRGILWKVNLVEAFVSGLAIM